MKKLFAVFMAAFLLCGCTSEAVDEAKDVPAITEANFAEMDIATYKKDWYGTGSESNSALNNSAERYESTDVPSGQEFVFEFSQTPNEVEVTEYYIRDDEIIISSDEELESLPIESSIDGNKLTFSISPDSISGKRCEQRMVVMDCRWDGKTKGSIEYAFLLEVIDESIVDSDYMHPAGDMAAVEGVELIVDAADDESATIRMTNNSGRIVLFDDWYRIDVEKDGEWYRLKFGSSVITITWTSEVTGIMDGVEMTETVNWENIYDELEAGTYRIVKRFSFDGENEKYEVCGEFAITD